MVQSEMSLSSDLLPANLTWSFKTKQKKQCEIFEIKHSKELFPAQCRHINDEEKISLTETQFGKVVRKCVIYRGESEMLENGVEYKNVEEFLKGLVC